MSDREGEYIFHGRVLPYRVTPSMKIPAHDFSAPVGELNIDFTIRAGVITVIVQTEADPNIYTLRNIVRSLGRSWTDMYAYAQGYYYDLEILSVLLPDDSRITFPVSFRPLEHYTRKKDFEQWVAEIYSGFNGETGIYLRRAVSDLRDALEHADDTPFHCYRALESLKQYFAEEGMSDSEMWDELWNELDMDNNIPMGDMLEYSKDIRHGEPRNTSGDQREEHIFFTHRAIERFIEVAVDEEDIEVREE